MLLYIGRVLSNVHCTLTKVHFGPVMHPIKQVDLQRTWHAQTMPVTPQYTMDRRDLIVLHWSENRGRFRISGVQVSKGGGGC